MYHILYTHGKFNKLDLGNFTKLCFNYYYYYYLLTSLLIPAVLYFINKFLYEFHHRQGMKYSNTLKQITYSEEKKNSKRIVIIVLV